MLVVGLNSDASVRMIKGPRRPLNPETLRAEVLSGLCCVDLVVLFEEPDPLALITALQPDVLVKGADWAEDRIIGADIVKQRDVLVKGADWAEDRIIGADIVKQRGGRVERIALVPDISTSTLIDRIRERYC